MEAPRLAGRRVVLEELREADAAELWPHARDPAVWRYMPAPVRSEAELLAWVRDRRRGLADGTAFPFVQRNTATGEAVGSTSLFDIDRAKGVGEVGHTWLAASARRTPFNTEAKLLLLGHAFDALGLQRVQLKCDARNAPSRRAIERLGATYEGTLRSTMPLADGTRRDSSYYSILAPEWPAVRRRLEGLLAQPRPAHAPASP